jgi:hypothetical protein
MSERLYKVLHADGRACHGGTGTWHLPTPAEDGTWTPGEWMPRLTGEIEPCSHGYHLCRPQDLLGWLTSDVFSVYEAEAHPRYRLIVAGDKVVTRQARLLRRLAWDARAARLFACDCAERALVVWERHGIPGDTRPRDAIAVARRYADGQATQEELAAARDAAWDAARAATRDAAWDAAWAADGAADGAAAWDAARAAAGAAAWDADVAAAWAAAWAAARDAARAAAGAAAWDAAWDAAWAAAWDAERQWQVERLLWYLDGQPTTSHATTEEVSR